MLIECPTCNARVNGMILWSGPGEHAPFAPGPFLAYVAMCPSCGNMMFAAQLDESEMSGLRRLWPPDDSRYFVHAPRAVNESLQEADRCLNAGAFSACAVMAGRAIEGVCREYGSKNVGLSMGIRELKEKGILDERLGRWAQELRIARNAAAHPEDLGVTELDARDLLAFARAICTHLFELDYQYACFIGRRIPDSSGKAEDPDPAS